MAYIMEFCKSDSIGDKDILSIVGFSNSAEIRAECLTKD
jgi:hypothetical protein